MTAPYPLMSLPLGGVPSVKIDVPICSVFIVLFLAGALTNMVIFRRNRARGHKFIPSAATFGFCITRIAANSLRIAWACTQTNVHIIIAAQIFVTAGIVILLIINLIYAQRIFRSIAPRYGWAPTISRAMQCVYFLIILNLVIAITALVLDFYSVDTEVHRVDLELRRYTGLYNVFVSFLPYPILILAITLRGPPEAIEKFGRDSWKSKSCILIPTTLLLCLGACYRAVFTFLPPRDLTEPTWYDSRACFYVFNFSIEILVVFFFTVCRVDQRFHVPDGSYKLRSYLYSLSEKVDIENEASCGTRIRLPSTITHLDD